MPEKTVDNYVNGDRISELWAAIKTLLALKADKTDLEDYTTPDAVATAIAAALTTYATNESVTSAITLALVDYMTESEVNDAIAAAVSQVSGISFEAVDSLPATGEANKIYLVANGSTGNNTRDEYMYVNGSWEIIGSTSVDLTNYWSKSDLTVMTAEELQEILV